MGCNISSWNFPIHLSKFCLVVMPITIPAFVQDILSLYMASGRYLGIVISSARRFDL